MFVFISIVVATFIFLCIEIFGLKKENKELLSENMLLHETIDYWQKETEQLVLNYRSIITSLKTAEALMLETKRLINSGQFLNYEQLTNLYANRHTYSLREFLHMTEEEYDQYIQDSQNVD